MNRPELLRVERELQTQGWTVAAGSAVTALYEIAKRARWQRIANSPGASRQSTLLQPKTRESAAPRSLSAIYGLDAQPLHTDGAHLKEPPDIILLSSLELSSTDTVIYVPPREHGQWTFDENGKPSVQPGLPEHIRQGIFTVHGNEGKFLAPAYQNGRMRFDPVVMSAGDAHARATIKFFESAQTEAVNHKWDRPELLLFVDNRRVLHARAKVADDAVSRRVNRYAFRQVAT